MKKKAKLWLASGIIAVAVLGGGGYALMNNYVGNNVEIESVIPSSSPAAASPAASADATSEATGAATGEQLNGKWAIADSSNVYFSVTTSKETVNFVDKAVSGDWALNVDDPSQTSATGTIDMTVIDSGNSQRDEHVKSADFFDAGQFPQATFTATAFEGLPGEWTEGTAYDFTMKGTLNVRGIDKDVTFASKAVYNKGQLLLSGTTTVTFDDFGMKNPHSVVLSTENDVAVRLELVLDKS
ncbi:YceI family protein [Gorillibacterium timonense]|uniref:YceI family protein n=1 Tax=Gorillibacterium timonense TaxID=1689269 RepID=UPI00071D1876|nr:YceI family protein [Gorillibacterium timonense]